MDTKAGPRRNEQLQRDAQATLRAAKAERLQPAIVLDRRPERLRINLPVSIDSLLANWSTGFGYAARIIVGIHRVRDDKLARYTEQVEKAGQDLRDSFAKTKIWQQVFEQRYGMRDDGSDTAAFIEQGVKANVPEDMTNVSRFIRLRTILQKLQKDKCVREGGPLDTCLDRLRSPPSPAAAERESRPRLDPGADERDSAAAAQTRLLSSKRDEVGPNRGVKRGTRRMSNRRPTATKMTMTTTRETTTTR